MKRKIFIYVTEHCDLMWRRCFDRDFTFKGQNFVSYSDLEAYYIIENMKLCDKYAQYHFTIESPAMLKKFLEKYPEYEDKIKFLFEKQQVFVPFTGNNIIDTNLVSGETIVRNFLSGYQYLKQNFDATPYGISRCDAFGNSAQLPQIARKFGSAWVYSTSYSTSPKRYWRGLDGSTVLICMPREIGNTGGYFKYRPCPACNGHKDHDCPVCNNMRIDLAFMESLRVPVSKHIGSEDEPGIPSFIYCGGEEILPSEDIIKWAEENSDKYDITFIDLDAYVPYFQDRIDHADDANEDEIHPSVELNPNNSGCYVTRIRTKQTTRENENLLLAAETLSVANHLASGQYPYEQLAQIWDTLLFTAFHDAITATHIDAAYEEFMDTASFVKTEAQKICHDTLCSITTQNDTLVTVYNPYGNTVTAYAEATVACKKDIVLLDNTGNPVSISEYTRMGNTVRIRFLAEAIPAFSTQKYTVCNKETPYQTEKITLCEVGPVSVKPILTNESATQEITHETCEIVIENEYYHIKAAQNGIQEIFDKRLGKIIAAESEYMVGEWILEHDEGSPWTTLSMDMRRQRMRPFTTLIAVEKTEDSQKLTFFVRPDERAGYAVLGMKFQYSVILQRKDDKVHFSADVSWYTQNYRLRVAMPTLGEAKHFYEIPYGVLERKPYAIHFVDGNGNSDWSNASGDYPAINWAGVQNADYSLAMFNKGTPSYQIRNDANDNATIYLSVLRSPSVASFLNCALEYTMTDYDGMRDCGEHHFEYAIKAYDTGFAENDAVTDGIAYNAKLLCTNGDFSLPQLPKLDSKDARIASIKLAEDKQGIILRICEYHGKDSDGTLKLPEALSGRTAYETDLKETSQTHLPQTGNRVSLQLKPFEIKTVLLK